MPNIKIEGVGTVKVDEGFFKLSFEQQAATVDEIIGQQSPQQDASPQQPAQQQDPQQQVALQGGTRTRQGIVQAQANSSLLDPQAQQVGPGVPEGAARAFLGQGVALGFGDEIEAGARSLSGPETYEQELEAVRQKIAEFKEGNPGIALTAEIAGAIATSIVPGIGLARGATLARQALRGAGVGATVGATQGFGTGEGGFENRAERAGIGLGVGALAGAAAPPLIAGGLAAARGVGNVISGGVVRGAVNADGVAARKIQQAAQTDAKTGQTGLSPQDLQAAQREGQPINLIDRAGEETRALARSAANTSPDARAALDASIGERFSGQGDRTVEFVNRLVGGRSGTKTRESLQARAAAANRPAYKKAYQDGDRPIWGGDLEQVAQSPAVQNAIKKATKTGANRAAIEGFTPIKNPFVFNRKTKRMVLRKNVKPTLQFWDFVKRNLDDQISTARRQGAKSEATDITALKNQLLSSLDDAVPSYKSARQGAAAFFGEDDALAAGEAFVTSRMPGTLEQTRNAIAKMSQPERDLFADGFASSLIEKVNRTGDRRNVITQIFGSKESRQKIALAIGPKRMKEFETFIRVENVMDIARAAVQGNSTTARQLAELGMAGQSTRSLLVGSLSNKVTTIALIAGSFVKGGIDKRVAKRVGEMLASDDPAMVKRAVAAIAKSQSLHKALQRVDIPLAAAAGQQASQGANE